jgi:hypothetical protein
MIKILSMVLGFMLVQASWAQTGASVVLLKGTATFAGKPLSKNSQFNGNGEITVGDKSYLKILLSESQTTLVIGANTTSKINLAAPPEKQELNLSKGIARWVTGSKKGLGVRTNNSVMGIRGTDFFTSYNPALKETEIICFDGQIEMANSQDDADKKTISKNQWGGIGGRFGKKLSEVLTLSPELISSFDGALPK